MTVEPALLKGLQWRNIDLFARLLTVPTSKTVAGERTLPLTDEALGVLIEMHQRAEIFGSVAPDHYVFAATRRAARFNRKEIAETYYTVFDPTRPVRCWRTAWRNLTKEAGKQLPQGTSLEKEIPEWVL